MKLIGSAFRVKYVTNFQPTNIQSVFVVAVDPSEAWSKTEQQGGELKQQRDKIAIEILANEVYL